MRYFEGDIVKIDASAQQLGVNYEIYCPFVTATEDYDGVGSGTIDGVGSGTIWADGKLRNTRTGNVIDGRFLYFVRGSVLYQCGV